MYSYLFLMLRAAESHILEMDGQIKQMDEQITVMRVKIGLEFK